MKDPCLIFGPDGRPITDDDGLPLLFPTRVQAHRFLRNRADAKHLQVRHCAVRSTLRRQPTNRESTP